MFKLSAIHNDSNYVEILEQHFQSFLVVYLLENIQWTILEIQVCDVDFYTHLL